MSIMPTQVPYKVGSFWTAKQRQGHSLHEISYRACFKPQLVEHFIKDLTNAGDVVLDPFMGRGTTVLESALNDRIAYGSDINPLSEMLALPRLAPPILHRVLDRLNQIPKFTNIPDNCRELQVFFHKDTLRQLLAMKKWFADRSLAGTFDEIDGWIRMVVLNRLTGHSSGFLSVRTMPPNQAVSIKSQAKINERTGNIPRPRDIIEIVMKKSKSLLRSGSINNQQQHKLACCLADKLEYVEDNSVDLVLTSPPFLDVVNYAQDNWLRCWFAGIDTKKIKMNIHKNIDDWSVFVKDVFTEFARVVKFGGHVAFEVGDVRKGKIMLDEIVIGILKDLPFKLHEIIVNQQNFTKTANCWGVKNNSGGTLTNRIVVVRKYRP